ncbi:MAG: hypothetical protein RLZZ15_1283, partial [Verrucomicrobiota bacterium]
MKAPLRSARLRFGTWLSLVLAATLLSLRAQAPATGSVEGRVLHLH